MSHIGMTARIIEIDGTVKTDATVGGIVMKDAMIVVKDAMMVVMDAIMVVITYVSTERTAGTNVIAVIAKIVEGTAEIGKMTEIVVRCGPVKTVRIEPALEIGITTSEILVGAVVTNLTDLVVRTTTVWPIWTLKQHLSSPAL